MCVQVARQVSIRDFCDSLCLFVVLCGSNVQNKINFFFDMKEPLQIVIVVKRLLSTKSIGIVDHGEC